jgi:hypothetical protein
MLLLLDFFEGFSIGTALFPLAIAPRSAVIFSCSRFFAEGICASDFRDFGRVAGRVDSSREAIVNIELNAPDRVGQYCDQLFMDVVM